MRCAAAAALAAVALVAAQPDSQSGGGDGYTYYCIGVDCSRYAAAATRPGVVLMGGSTDVDAGFEYQISRAGGGDFLVLRATGTDAYNPYIWELAAAVGASLNTVTTVILSSAAGAAADFVVNAGATMPHVVI